jgi:hypothetical protein
MPRRGHSPIFRKPGEYVKVNVRIRTPGLPEINKDSIAYQEVNSPETNASGEVDHTGTFCIDSLKDLGPAERLAIFQKAQLKD